MKKKLYLFLSLLIVCTIFAGCGTSSSAGSSSGSSSSSSAATDPAKDTKDITADIKKNDTISATLPSSVKTAGKITIGVDDSYPPMEFRNDTNTLVGFDVDFGNALGKKLGVKVEWVPTQWDGIIVALKASKFDMILSSLSDTAEREKEITYSKPYIQGGPVIVVKKGTKGITKAEDLKGKLVGVQKGTTGEDAIKQMGGYKNLTAYDKITDALQDLGIGRTEAVVADDQVGRYYVGLASDKYEVVGKMNEEPFGIGFKKDNTALRDSVQQAIDELKSDGTLSKISKKWFGIDYYK
ncbi:MAG: ABC transporter substrate-binding protein [Bacillota bacterium]|nr:ABC transporter substrate-binding protein [Bacillota bacterium]